MLEKYSKELRTVPLKAVLIRHLSSFVLNVVFNRDLVGRFAEELCERQPRGKERHGVR